LSDIEEIRRSVEAEIDAKARRISVGDLLEKALYAEVYVPELGGKLRFKKLTWKEVLEIRKYAKSDEEMTTLAVHKALSAVDPSVTLEQVENLPADVMFEIVNALFPRFKLSETPSS
jgi:hypothetical protein